MTGELVTGRHRSMENRSSEVLPKEPSLVGVALHQSEKYWSEEAMIYAKAHPRLKLIAKLLTRQRYRRLLDIGCSSATLKELLPPDFEYFGSDITRLAESHLSPAHFLQADFNDRVDLSHFQRHQINCLHIGGVLEYLHRPKELLQAVRQLVPVRTPLLVTLINFEGKRFSSPKQHHEAWVYKPTMKELQADLEQSGFRLRRIYPFTERQGWRGFGFYRIANVLGSRHPWVKHQSRQFIYRTVAI
jgi:hypothetical protein